MVLRKKRPLKLISSDGVKNNMKVNEKLVTFKKGN